MNENVVIGWSDSSTSDSVGWSISSTSDSIIFYPPDTTGINNKYTHKVPIDPIANQVSIKKVNEDGSYKLEFPDRVEYYNPWGKLHNDDGPAIEYTDGCKVWAFNGEYHRKGGPAFIYPDGRKEWWLNGKKLDKKDFLLVPELIEIMGAEELLTVEELLSVGAAKNSKG